MPERSDYKLPPKNPAEQPAHGQQTAGADGEKLQVNDGDPVLIEPPGTGVIRALPGNSGKIYVGGSNVDTNGMPLQAGEDLSNIHVQDLSKYYVHVVNSGDGFAWLAETG